MNKKAIFLAFFTVVMTGCANEARWGAGEGPLFCQGFECANRSEENSGQAENHKPTQEEKRRVMRGEDPDFGSENISIGGTLPVF
ncbi:MULTISPECIES: hypothetical protein [Serratia]|uniref:hypothetical protein n=1 Tax=Serratia TaxID=613 RepID=UPI001F4C3577|nr:MULTISPECIES: hypothetical protein [Serratia]ULG11029.1 hypothetical protein 220p1_00147 [Serratia entomophila]CAI1954304.1 Uncharacterised protein [Serratia quinivorans]CAI2159087.1 Uncharacterised protein [Serratia quinivorans]